ncbi:RNA polymerase sigma factor [Flectobacillus major]|uniref:RNA polymerase sigma factor n=1 Tax=Flectobacillus major TaxID=103 RepID=UPI00041FF633|nr:RNA polymerase sigma factor [Flectobacillus major]
MPNNEKDLVIACQRNDPKAQTAFYNLYKGRLLGVCRRYAHTVAEAEDIFQEAFIKIFKHIHTLENIDAVNYWVKSTVIRTAIDHYRHAIHEREQMGYEQAADIIDGHEDIFSSLGREQILQVINALPDGYRLVINLYLIDGYNHIEIAEMLNVTEGTSKSQLSRGRNLLKKELLKIGYQKV